MDSFRYFFALFALVTVACGDDDPVAVSDGGTDSASDAGSARQVYLFESRFTPGTDSVDHGGQTARQQLILAVKGEFARISSIVLGGNESEIDTLCEGGDCDTGNLAVYDLLLHIYEGDMLTGVEVPFSPEAGTMLCDPSSNGSVTHDDLGTGTLKQKLAGNDSSTDHRDWSTAFEGFTANPELVQVGGTAAAIATPEALLLAFFSTFHELAAQCIASAANCPANGAPVFVTPGGLDLQQLSEKLLHVAISFSQATDDYLDDDVPEKGLQTDNADERMKDGSGTGDTALAHVWDEAFGYFGAAIDYSDYSDADIRGSGLGSSLYRNGYHDYNSDSCISLASEVNLGAAVNAAKRDLGSTTGTDYTTTIFEAFHAGRDLIHTTERDLTSTELTALAGYRDTAVLNWERVIAATAVHYINDVSDDLNKCGTTTDSDPDNNFDLADVAKHFSELKGFALGFQFNPRSPWNTASHDFAALHALIGDAPTLCQGSGGDQPPTAYLADLATAGGRIQDAYGFNTADVENW